LSWNCSAIHTQYGLTQASNHITQFSPNLTRCGVLCVCCSWVCDVRSLQAHA
jgi:hypothetical protein